MLESLKINGYYVDFRRYNPIRFVSGLTLVTGRNGSGKSSVIELVRFALFGACEHISFPRRTCSGTGLVTWGDDVGLLLCGRWLHDGGADL